MFSMCLAIKCYRVCSLDIYIILMACHCCHGWFGLGHGLGRGFDFWVSKNLAYSGWLSGVISLASCTVLGSDQCFYASSTSAVACSSNHLLSNQNDYDARRFSTFQQFSDPLSETDLRHVQHVRRNVTPQKGSPHRPENVWQQRDIFWPVEPLGACYDI